MKRGNGGAARALFMVAMASALIIAPNTVAANSTVELLRQCELSRYGFCLRYITGFYDGRTTEDYGMPALKACLPTERDGLRLAVTHEQMVLVFIKWAKDHPENHH